MDGSHILPGCEVLPPIEPSPDEKAGSTSASTNQVKGSTHAERKTGSRFAVLNAFLDFTAAGLTRAEMLVWLILFRDTKPDGLARTSAADIARRAGVNLRTVKRATNNLQRRQLLKVARRGGLRQGPSSYRVRPLAPPGAR
ncbi:MAG TPA: helix-turn-helix domain-containing protein [Pirellulales bacterium]|nr:helix-turn-helix domain-containing protein [Pirellulales bacterium]